MNNDNPTTSLWRKTDYIGKIEVKRDKTALLSTANLVKTQIAGFLQSFIKDRMNVMPGRRKDVLCSCAKILVELEFHAANSIGISMKRSRDISAP